MRPGARLPALCSWLTVAAGVLGALTGAPMLTTAAAALVLLLVLALGWLTRPDPPVVTLERPDALVLGRPTVLRLVVENPGARALRLSPVLDVPAWIQVAALEPLAVGPGDAVSVAVAVTAERRGFASLGPLRAWVGVGAGVIEIAAAWPGAEDVPVLPRAAATGSPRARRLAKGRRHLARRAGRGTELERLRAYEPGDELRHVHWPATARLGRAITRVMRDEDAPRVLLAIEASRRMGAPDGPQRTRMDRAVEASLALAAHLTKHRVGLVIFDRRIRDALPATRGHGAALLRALGPLQPSAYEPDYQELMRHLHDHTRRRSLVVVIGCPEGDELSRALPLLHRRHRVVVAALGDRALRELAGHAPTRAPVQTLDDLHARASALRLLERRRRRLTQLRRTGVTVLDVEAAQAEVRVRDACLAVLSRGA